MNIQYLAEWIKLTDYNPLITGSTQPKISKEGIMSVPVLFLSIEKYEQIISNIKKETANVETAIAKAERKIELNQGYKEEMINKTVIGKRKINFAN